MILLRWLIKKLKSFMEYEDWNVYSKRLSAWHKRFAILPVPVKKLSLNSDKLKCVIFRIIEARVSHWTDDDITEVEYRMPGSKESVRCADYSFYFKSMCI